MIAPGAATKVHLLAGATDMRRGFDGLYALARGLLAADPLSGQVFGFCNKVRNRLMRMMPGIFLQGATQPVFLIVDGHPSHKAKKVSQWIASQQGKIRLFLLP